MKSRRNNNTNSVRVCEVFNSVLDFISTINSRPRAKGASNASETASERFSKTKDYAEAKQLALYGDYESAKKIGEAERKLSLGTHSIETKVRTRTRRAVAGQRPCVPAAIVGHPTAMYLRRREHILRPVINIAYNASANCDVSANDIILAGAKVCQALKAIEAKNIRVNLYYATFAQRDNEQVALFVRVKDADKDMTNLRLAFPFVNPSMLRRHYFRWIEGLDKITQNSWYGSYGAAKNSSEFNWAAFPSAPKDCIFLDYSTVAKSEVSNILKLIEGAK